MAKSNTPTAPAAAAISLADQQPLIHQAMAQPELDQASTALALVKARVLVDGAFGKCNDVIDIDPELAATCAGTVDTSPAAVAYAESLSQE